MQLHDLLAGLAGFDGAGVLELRPEPAPAVEIKSVVHDSRDGATGRVVLLHPRRGHRRPRVRAGGGRGRARSRCSSRSGCRVDVPQARVASVRAVLGPLAARFHGEPSLAMRVLGVTGTNGKTTTTYLLEAIATAAGDVAGVIGTVAARVGDRRALGRAHHARGDRAAGGARRDARRRRRDGRDGGVVARARSAPRRRDQLRGDLLHEPLARPPRLSRLGRRVLRGQGAAVHAGVHAPRRDQRRRPARRRSWRGAPPRNGLVVTRFAVGDSGRRARGRRARAASRAVADAARPFDLVTCSSKPVRGAHPAGRLVQRRERARPPRRPRCSPGFELDAIVAGLERPIVVPGRMERVDAGQDFTVLVDYAHTPDALRVGARRGPRSSSRPARRLIVRVRLRRRPRPREAPADGRDRGAPAPTARTSPPTTRAPRIPPRSPTTSSPACRRRRAVERDPRPARRDPRRGRGARDRATSWSSRARVTRRARSSATARNPFDDRVVARAELEARAS